PGSDADIVLFNPKEEWTIKADLLHHKSDWTPFEGLRVKGRVKTTISRGKVIVKDGETTGSSGWGSFIARYLRKA
ncbi:MAG: dihydropyrimidinase, partial [Thermoproteota archaeon]